MKRRNAIKQLGFIATGTLLLPSCLSHREKAPLALKNITLTGQQQATIVSMANTLIPSSDGVPGAKELDLAHFSLKMVDECTNTETQDTFIKGLQLVEREVTRQYGDPFDELSEKDQLEFLNALEKRASEAAAAPPASGDEEKPDPVISFYKTLKRYTIQGFVTSEPVLGNIFGYQQVPGHFIGSVPVTNASDVKTIMG